jgi:putative FmdB family regulatory protein
MPLYTYRCTKCEHCEDRVNKWAERLQEYPCPECDGVLQWQGVEAPSSLSGKEGYQMNAILGNGQKVKGHFGKSAKLRRH